MPYAAPASAWLPRILGLRADITRDLDTGKGAHMTNPAPPGDPTALSATTPSAPSASGATASAPTAIGATASAPTAIGATASGATASASTAEAKAGFELVVGKA